MESTVVSDVARRARRAYEAARLRRGLVRAAALGLLLGLVSVLALGPAALPWLPVFVVVWTFLEWRGGGLLRGGRIGALLGIPLALMPASTFMRCCRAGCAMATGECSMSRACAVVGAVMGLAVAGLLARLPQKDRLHATVGAALGVVATSVPRCSSLMLGEAAGLLLGALAGTIAAGLVCAALDRARQPA